MSTELLIPVSKEAVLHAFKTGEGIEKIIEDTKDLVKNFNHDLKTGKSRQATISFANDISSMKVKLDDMRKGSIEKYNVIVKATNKNGKILRDSLDLLRDEARKPVTEWENAEKERVALIKEKVERIKDLSTKMIICLSPRLSELIEAEQLLVDTVIDSSFEEFELEAIRRKETSLEDLANLIRNKKEEIAKEEELENLREAAAAQKIKDREEEIKKEAAANATREAEEKAKKETDRIEKEKNDAIERENILKLKAEESERSRVADAERVRVEKLQAEERRVDAEKMAKFRIEEAAEKSKQEQIKAQKDKEAKEEQERIAREADGENTGKKRKEAKECLMALKIDEATAKRIVLAIDQGRIDNVTISY